MRKALTDSLLSICVVLTIVRTSQNSESIDEIVSEQPPVRWWAQQVLFDERKRSANEEEKIPTSMLRSRLAFR